MYGAPSATLAHASALAPSRGAFWAWWKGSAVQTRLDCEAATGSGSVVRSEKASNPVAATVNGGGIPPRVLGCRSSTTATKSHK